MRGGSATCRAGLLLVLAVTFAPQAPAEIYTWVDADGKVHFGDKPTDPVQARNAQAVQLKQGYQPSVRTAQEQEAYDNEQQANQRRTDLNRREAQAAKDRADAARREEQAASCAKYDASLRELGTVEREGRRRIVRYATNADGSSVSSDQQRAIIAELKAQRARAGCP